MSTQTHPEMSFDVLELYMSRQHSTVEQLQRADKTVTQAKRVQSDTYFPSLVHSMRLGPFNEWKLNVFCDASWGNLPDGVSFVKGHVSS